MVMNTIFTLEKTALTTEAAEQNHWNIPQILRIGLCFPTEYMSV